MTLLIAIDPGLRHSGIAVYDGAELAYATLVKSPEKSLRGVGAWRAMALAVAEAYPLSPDYLVLETMKVYRGARSDPDDLLELQGVTGCIAGLVTARHYVNYLAKTWTRGVPKDVRIRRLQSTWTADQETACDWPSESLKHNVYDAIGLGAYALTLLNDSREAA